MATLKIFNSFSEPTRWEKESGCEAVILPKGTNQVERNPAFHLLLKLHAFCFNYSNLTRNNNPQIFLVPKHSLLPPHKLAVFHTLEVTSDKLRAVFWNWSSTGQIGQHFTEEKRGEKKKEVVFFTQAIKIPFRQLFKLWKETEWHKLYLSPSHTQALQHMKHKKVPISTLRRWKLGFASLLPGNMVNITQNTSTCSPTGCIIRQVLAFSSCWCSRLL